MDNDSAADDAGEATPLFTAYRRGYDPEQVDRYVADQRRRLDDAMTRATEAERKLAAAVGQLRELHRRVAVLESEDRSTAQTPALDAIGERIQRILQEAWDGAYAMRQAAENDANELRERARTEAESIIATARQKAVMLGEELERRRSGFLQRVEEERSKAVTQMTFLSEQRKIALNELVRIRTLLDATVEEFSETPITVAREVARPEASSASRPAAMASAPNADSQAEPRSVATMERPRAPETAESVDTDGLPRTMPVHRLPEPAAEMPHDPSELVRSHRAMAEAPEHSATVHELDSRRPRPALFDFEEADSSDEH